MGQGQSSLTYFASCSAERGIFHLLSFWQWMKQTVNNSGIVYNSDEVFSFFSALPEMQSHRQLTHLGMGVRGAVCTRELLQEERERVKAASEGGRREGPEG